MEKGRKKMVMNLSQDEYKKSRKPFAALKTYEPQKHEHYKDNKIELTRNPAFLDGAHDIFDLLARKGDPNTDALERTLGSTIALLKRSHLMLKDAEDTITSQNKRLEDLEALCTTDEVSGLLNQRGFYRNFSQEVARSQRDINQGGLLVMFSLENLGRIRKKHGGVAADSAVKLIARALESEIRTCDHAARLLDDEFVLLFTDTNMDKSLLRLQNMALRLNKLSLLWNGEDIRLNLSLGLKSFTSHERADTVFKAACDDLHRNRKG